MAKIDHKQLLKFCNQLLSTGGMAKDDADLVAELLVRGELRGYPGHGVIRVNPYLNWIKEGTYQVKDKPAIEREGKLTAVVDGKHYIGQVAAHFAMELAINKAKEHGAGIVCLRRAGHTGRLADYMEMATAAGMIGIGAASVGSAVTALHGAMSPITGTNPMSFGIPARGGKAIVLDFATASMSMGEIQTRVRKKEKIPQGVMLDGHGNPTTDFNAFKGPPRGVFTAFGAHKGSGIALMTEILGGILSGNGMGKLYWDNRGHGVNGLFLQAIAVDEFQEREKFYDQIDEMIDFIKSTKRAPGFAEILLPGESGRRREAKNQQEGVDVEAPTWDNLTALAAKLGITEVPAPL